MRPARPSFELEIELWASGHGLVAGLDEVGRGAWAGPVSVGVAVVDRGVLEAFPSGVRDSKQLTARAREALMEPLVATCRSYGVGHASNLECDALGMTAAQALAASRALASLEEPPDTLIVDGNHEFTGFPGARTLVGADSRSLVVAAASVLAKVTRDRLMIEHSNAYPGYGFERHKGYPSPAHRDAVALLGLSPLHRRSWSVVFGDRTSAEEAGTRL